MSTSKQKSKAQRKKEREKLQKAQMAAQLNLIQQISKSRIQHNPLDDGNKTDGGGVDGRGGGSKDDKPTASSTITSNVTVMTSVSSTTMTTTIVSSNNNNATNSSSLNPKTPVPPVWPPAPRIPSCQSLSYGWKIAFPANPNSLRPVPMGFYTDRGEAMLHSSSNKVALDKYKEARRQRYLKAATQAGVQWHC